MISRLSHIILGLPTLACEIVMSELIAIQAETVVCPVSVVANLLTAVNSITTLINVYKS